MSFKRLVVLVLVVALSAVTGCSSGRGANAVSSTVFSDPPLGPSTSLTLAAQEPAEQAVNAWKSDVIVKISRNMDGGDSGGPSSRGSLSDDGRYVAFLSSASDLVPGDTNRRTPAYPGHTGSDVFVCDRETGVIERVSVAGDGTQADGDSEFGFISATGRWVVFDSVAGNLVPGDENKTSDVFLHDRLSGSTDLVSSRPDGLPGDDWSYARGVSADGRYVVFLSMATDLVAGDTNKVTDVFVRDMKAGVTERMSVSTSGNQGDKESGDCAISDDGRFVAFQSFATGLVPGDTNKSADMFVRDRKEATTERVSVSSAGVGGNDNCWDCSISADGRYVAFTSAATNLVSGDTSHQRNDVFVYDRQTKKIKRISVSPTGEEGNNSSGSPSLSSDGRYVAFLSFARNLVSGDTNKLPDAFVRDLKTGRTWRVSLAAKGVQADEGTPGASISGDGRWVAFTSQATNLVREKIRMDDVFVTKAQR
jgi:Tol biopolymer transport system component